MPDHLEDIDPKDSHEDDSYHGEVLQSPGREQLIAQAGAIFGPVPDQPIVEHPWETPTPVPEAVVEEDDFGAHVVTEDGSSVTTEDMLVPPMPEDDTEDATDEHAIGDHDVDPYHEDPVDHSGLDHDHDGTGELIDPTPAPVDPHTSWDDTEK